ncbi:MAG: GNAT family N-acetyltransferase [Odoribacter splanchnicus]
MECERKCVNNGITIRAYRPEDKGALVHLIRLNTPGYFAPEEEADFCRYLDYERELYYVLLWGAELVGCGGINFAEDETVGKISWDMIHPEYQGRSLGGQLLKYRIERIKSIPRIRKITVRTSQLAYRFYEKQGFVLNEVRKDYWAEGYDLYSMVYDDERGR